MILTGIVISALIWVFILAPIMLAIPRSGQQQNWLEKEHRNSGIRIFVFWPYYLMRSYYANKELK